jgi:signal transduction histidine kinase
MLVHDLRNPLSSLISSLSIMDDERMSEKQRRILELAQGSGNALLGMIGDILDVNKAEAGEMRLQREPIDFGLLLETARDQLAFSARAAGVSLSVWADPDLPVLWADPEKLRRVLVNLVANGIQPSRDKGSVIATARPNAARDAVVFTVEDQWAGIPVELQTRIFEKFFTVQARREGTPSCGLGLVFCKKVVDAHRGEIKLKSEPGRGTKFSVSIPVQKRA